jgi:ATP-dependent Clp protease protease subunit
VITRIAEPGAVRLITPGFSRPGSSPDPDGPDPHPQPRPPWPPVRPVPAPDRPDRPGTGFRLDESAVTLELADRLLHRRIVMLAGNLDHALATRAAAQLMLLDADSAEAVQLHLSCPDGDLDAALMLADTLDLMRAPITATGRGTIGGPAVVALAAADRRLAHPHCLVVLREPRGTASGRAAELAIAADQHARRVRDLCERLAAATGRDVDAIGADLRQGRVLTAAQAVDYGLLHDLAVLPD